MLSCERARGAHGKRAYGAHTPGMQEWLKRYVAGRRTVALDMVPCFLPVKIFMKAPHK